MMMKNESHIITLFQKQQPQTQDSLPATWRSLSLNRNISKNGQSHPKPISSHWGSKPNLMEHWNTSFASWFISFPAKDHHKKTANGTSFYDQSQPHDVPAQRAVASPLCLVIMASRNALAARKRSASFSSVNRGSRRPWIVLVVHWSIWTNVGKTMPQTTHDWEWFIPPMKIVISGMVCFCFYHIRRC